MVVFYFYFYLFYFLWFDLLYLLFNLATCISELQ
jgi:hypothetical protein